MPNKITALKRALAIFMLIILCAVSAYADTPFQTYAAVSGTKSLNLRSGPGAENTLLESMPNGTWVEIYQESDNWAYIRNISTNAFGWASLKFLSKANTAGSIGTIAYVNNPPPTTKLNLRESPSLDSKVLGTFTNGTICYILGVSGGWCHVNVDGFRGYFKQEFLSFEGGYTPSGTASIQSVNGGKVNLRMGPGYSYGSLGQYSPGTIVSVITKGAGFWFVDINGQSGFVDSKFLTGGGSPIPSPSPNPSVANAMVSNTGKYLNLREQPSLSAKVLGHYYGGTELIIHSKGNTWSRVTVKHNGQSGYMMSRYISFYNSGFSQTQRVVHPKGSYVNLRTAPSLTYSSILLRVPHGSIVSVISQTGDWTEVMYGGTTGYMSKWFLR